MMAKWVSDAVLDGALQVIAGANRMVALSGQPADYSAAVSGMLAEAVVSTVDFSFQDGLGEARQVLVAAKDAVPVLAQGLADHVALLDGLGGRLLYVTTCPAQDLPDGGTVNFAGWSVEIGAPF
jgi:hypothetical protein